MWPRFLTLAKAVPIRWVLLALGIAAAVLYLRFARTPPPPAQTVPGPVAVAPEPKQIVKVERVTLPGPERIVYLNRAEVERKLNWPMISPDNVLAVAEVAPHAGKTTVIATARIVDNVLTSSILTRQEPPPFFDLKKEFSFEGRYLFAGRNVMEADLVATPLRVGPVQVRAGAGLEVRRDDSSIGARGWLGFRYDF